MLAGRDAIRTATDLREARAELTATRTALSEGNREAAAGNAGEALTAAARASERMASPLWQVFAAPPGLGDPADALRSAADLAHASAVAALAVVDHADDLFDDRGNLRVAMRDGAVDLAIFDDLARTLDAIPTDALASATSDLMRASQSAWLPGPVADLGRAAARQAEDVLADLRDARTAVVGLPGFLGGDGPQQYLLALQNPAELRATGGFISFLGLLEADGGRLSLGDVGDIDPLATDEDADAPSWRRTIGYYSRDNQPADAPADFAARYDRVAGRTWFGSANHHPDVPTVAGVMLDLWRQETGQQLDGVVFVTPQALKRVLEASGPLDVPDAVSHPGLPDPIPASALLETVLVDAYDVLGGRTPERRAYHRGVATAAFGKLLSGEWEPQPMLTALGGSVQSRDLMVHALAPAAAAAFDALGADGRFGVAPDADLVGLTANNTAANKLDVHVRHDVAVRIDVEQVDLDAMAVLRRTTVELDVHNAVDPAVHDDYVVGAWQPQALGEERQRDARIGLSRTLFTFWAPADANLLVAVHGDDTLAAVARGEYDAMATFDHQMEVLPGDTSTVRLTWRSWVPLAGDRRAPRLDVLWHPIASATPGDATLTVTTSDPDWAAMVGRVELTRVAGIVEIPLERR